MLNQVLCDGLPILAHCMMFVQSTPEEAVVPLVHLAALVEHCGMKPLLKASLKEKLLELTKILRCCSVVFTVCCNVFKSLFDPACHVLDASYACGSGRLSCSSHFLAYGVLRYKNHPARRQSSRLCGALMRIKVSSPVLVCAGECPSATAAAALPHTSCATYRASKHPAAPSATARGETLRSPARADWHGRL